MVEHIILQRICERCQGDGVKYLPGTSGAQIEDPCLKCDGDGWVDHCRIDVTDISDKLDDIIDKCNDIFEQVSE